MHSSCGDLYVLKVGASVGAAHSQLGLGRLKGVLQCCCGVSPAANTAGRIHVGFGLSRHVLTDIVTTGAHDAACTHVFWHSVAADLEHSR